MLGVGAGIVVVMMALVSWNSKYHRSFHVDVNENRNWNILMFLCQPIFLNLRHIFEDFLLTALLSRKVNMTQNWLNTIFCGIYNFSSENGAAFSQNWLINISVRYVATIIQVSSEIPPPFIIIVQFSSFEKDHSHHWEMITPGSDHCLSLIIYSLTPVVETAMMWLWLTQRKIPTYTTLK